MANVYFKHTTMGGGKTALACINAFNYEEQGLRPLCLSPKIDTRVGDFYRDDFDFEKGKWQSRIQDLERESFVIDMDDSVLDLLRNKNLLYGKFDVVMIDEVQFLNNHQIEELFVLAMELNIPVITYGLLTTYKTTLFEGSKRLIELGAKLEHIKSVGSEGKNTVVNAKFVDGQIVTEGEDIDVGGNEKYRAITLKDYFSLTNKKYF